MSTSESEHIDRPGREDFRPSRQIHIGQLIREELMRQERTPTWLAHKIHCQRPNIYYIFSQASINTQLLEAISRALNHNFFKYFDDTHVL